MTSDIAPGPKTMTTVDLSAFPSFCLDHIENFNAVPCEYEGPSGTVYNAEECWAAAERLGLTAKLKMSPDEIFEELIDGFGNSFQSECTMLSDWIKDIEHNERYDNGGKLTEASLENLDSSLSEIESTIRLIRDRLQELRQCESTR
jgi:hypothetical protein